MRVKHRASTARRANTVVLFQTRRPALLDWWSFGRGGVPGNSDLRHPCVVSVAKRLSLQAPGVGAALSGRIRLGVATRVPARPRAFARAPDGPCLACSLPT